MRATARILLRYADPVEAARVDRATRVDHGGFVASRVRGATVEADAAADSPMSLLHTLEDYLACAAVAERVSRK